MSDNLTSSRFHMWRAVIAMMHADQVIKPHEVNFILQSTKDVPMSDEQRQVLADDIKHATSIDEMFHKITHPADKEDFFHLARAIAWSDGDFDETERNILDRLRRVKIAGDDQNVLEHSLKSFEEIYLDKNASWKNRDKGVTSMIRQLLAGR